MRDLIFLIHAQIDLHHSNNISERLETNRILDRLDRRFNYSDKEMKRGLAL